MKNHTATVPIDRVAEARFVRPRQMFLRFADGFEGTWSFAQLGLNMSGMKVTTIKASDNCVEVKSKCGDDVELDTSWLCALIDPEYAAAIEKKLDAHARRIGI